MTLLALQIVNAWRGICFNKQFNLLPS